jgi:multicomponent Na+:H+ antiporter subunit A
MWIGPALLAVAGLALGIAPGMVERVVVTPAASAVLGAPTDLHIALWHGFNAALAMSIIAVMAGVGLYLGWAKLRLATAWMEVPLSWGPARLYGPALGALHAVARAQTLVLQNGRLRIYLMVTIGAAVGLGAYTLVSRDALQGPGSWTDVRLYQIGLAVLMLLAALYATIATSRLAAVASLSVVGYGVALIYILFGAPDLAMTQFMVETLTVILFVLVFYHLPGLRGLSGRLSRARDAMIALTAGGFMTALVLAASAGRVDSELASYYAEESVPGGHGQNVVNVILVDFRALDTLGEITVLSVAAFGVFALLRLRPRDQSARSRRIVGRGGGGGSDRPRSASPADERHGTPDMRGDEA